MPSHPADPPSGRKRGFAVAVSILAVLAVAIILFLWIGRHNGPATESSSILKVGDQRGGAQALLRAAGELDHVPYTIEFALFPAASPLLEALGANAIDIGGIGGAPFAFAYASGQPIKAVYAYRAHAQNAGRASAIIVGKDAPFRTLADLKGKKLATVRGSAGQDLALLLLEKAGLKAGDVQWVYLNNGEAKAALSSGSIDAWSTWGSYVGIAVLEDGDHVLADRTGVPPSAGFFAASDAAIAAKRPLITDFLRRLARARIWARSHPGDYAKALAKETGIPVPVALFSIQSYLGSSIPIDASVVAEQRAIFERYRRAGVIPTVPNLEGGYDASFNGAIQGLGN